MNDIDKIIERLQAAKGCIAVTELWEDKNSPIRLAAEKTYHVLMDDAKYLLDTLIEG